MLKRVVDLRLRERRVRAERHARARHLLPLNLRHEQVVPVVGKRTLSERVGRFGRACLARLKFGRCAPFVRFLLSATFAEGSCTTLVGRGQVAVEAAWQNGDTVGVDFCQESAVASRTFSTTISDGVQQSNAVETACAPAGAMLVCLSN